MTDPRARRAAALRAFCVANYILVLVSSLGFVGDVPLGNAATVSFLVAAGLSYAVLYILPATLLVAVAEALTRLGGGGEIGSRRRAVASAVAVGAMTVTQFALFADGFVFRMYGFHFNGFIWNIISTPGGIESLGAGGGTTPTVVLIGAAMLVGEALLLLGCFRLTRVRNIGGLVASRKRVAWVVAMFFVLAIGERAAYGLADLRAYRPVVRAGATFPFYARVRLRGIGERFGIMKERTEWTVPDPSEASLNYPHTQPVIPANDQPLNVVCLVSESLRFDMLDEEIMPATWEFGNTEATRFTRHMSAGNGTRMGMFGMFYGLHGAYWFRFLQEMRGPAVIDALLAAGYDVDASTSAKFSFPEFDKTIWVNVPPERLHEGDPELKGWQNDRALVGRLIESIEQRDKAQPFFRFMFFESPHARYTFPKESIIRRPYERTLNYVLADYDRDAQLIKNRYINSCHHLDSQLDRVFTYLRESGLLSNTIVIVTGDHGEAFMEAGHWGHHTTFSDWQIHTPLLIHVPGRAPAVVDRMTSHLDLVPTVLALLGERTPPDEYCLGYDLFGDHVRTSAVSSGWDNVAWIGDDVRIVCPLTASDFTTSAVFTNEWDEIEEPGSVYAAHTSDLLGVLDDLGRFTR